MDGYVQGRRKLVKIVTLKKKADNCISFRKSNEIETEESFAEAIAKLNKILEEMDSKNSIDTFQNFSHEIPLGTVKDGKERGPNNKFIDIDPEKGQKYKPGNIVLFMDQGKLKRGHVEEYLNGEARIVVENKTKTIPVAELLIFTDLAEYFKYEASLRKNDGQKLARIKSIVDSLPENYVGETLVPNDIHNAKGISSLGYATYDWPPFFGFKPETMKEFMPKRGQVYYRTGPLNGTNYETKKTSYGKKSIPYKNNRLADKEFYIPDPENFKNVIDSIRTENFQNFKRFVQNGVDLKKFSQIVENYNKYLSEFTRNMKEHKKIFNKIEMKSAPHYGIIGEAAPWLEYEGGATQVKLPLSGKILTDLNLIILRKDGTKN